jgi:hypothetical protein
MPQISFPVCDALHSEDGIRLTFSAFRSIHLWRVALPEIFRVAGFSPVFHALRAELCVEFRILTAPFVEGDEVRRNFRAAILLFPSAVFPCVMLTTCGACEFPPQ